MRRSLSHLVVLLLAFALGGLIVGLTRRVMPVGSVAEWLAGIGTVGALFYTARLFQLEISTRRVADESRRQRQASAVSAHVDARPVPSPDGGPLYRIVVTNASASPIFGVALNVDDVRLAVSRALPAGGSHEVMVPDLPRLLDVGFTDSEQRFWVRRWTGTLVEVPLAPGAIIVGGPQAFEFADYLDPRPKGIAKAPDLVRAVGDWERATGRKATDGTMA